ncbi:hypothetical protein IWQ61_004451 [Dispira simplex]|nr:hypothetical protein IWQ61_004451 [Dispira simplex]
MYDYEDEGYNGNEERAGETGYTGVGEDKRSSGSPRLQHNSHYRQTGEGGDIIMAKEGAFGPRYQLAADSVQYPSFIPDEYCQNWVASQPSQADSSPPEHSDKLILSEVDDLMKTVVQVDKRSTAWNTTEDKQEVVIPPRTSTFSDHFPTPSGGTAGQRISGTRYWSFGLPNVFSGPKNPPVPPNAVTGNPTERKRSKRLTMNKFFVGQPSQSPNTPVVHPGDGPATREPQPHMAPRPPSESFQEPVTYYSPNLLSLLAPKRKTSRRKPHPLTNSITPNQTISNVTALDPEIPYAPLSNNPTVSGVTTTDEFQASGSIDQTFAPRQRKSKGLWRRMTHRFAETWTGRTAEDSYTSLNPETSMDALSVLEERISHAVPRSTGPDVPNAYNMMGSPTLPLQLLQELTDSHGSLSSLPPPFPINPDFTSELAQRSAELDVHIEAVDPLMLTESQRATYIINDGDSFSRNSSTRKRQHRPRFISDTTGIRFNKKAFNLPPTRRMSAACPPSSQRYSSPSPSNASRTGDSLIYSTSSHGLSGSSSEYPLKKSNLVPCITHTGPSVESFRPNRPLGSSSSSGSCYLGKRDSDAVGSTLSLPPHHHNSRMFMTLPSTHGSGSVDSSHNLHRQSVMRGSVATSVSQGRASTTSLTESTFTSFRFTYPTPYYPTQPSQVLRLPSQSHTRPKSTYSRSSYRPGTDIYSEILSKGHRRPVNPPQSQLPSRQGQHISGGSVGRPPPAMARLSQSSTWDHPTLEEGTGYFGLFPCERYSFRQGRLSSRVHQHPGGYPPDAYQYYPPGPLGNTTGRPSGAFPWYSETPAGIGNNPRKHKFYRTWGAFNRRRSRWDGLDRVVDRILPPGVHTTLYKFFFVLGFVCPPCWWFATWCIPAPRDQVEITRESLRQRRLREWNKRLAQISVIIIPIILVIMLIHFKDYSNSPILYHAGPMHIEPSPMY